MAYGFRIIPAKEFLRLDTEGHFDLEGSQRLFADLIWACVSSGIRRVLLDIREAHSKLTAAEVSNLAEACHAVATPHDQHRVAILASTETSFDLAPRPPAAETGWKIGVFSDFESAFSWLVG